MHFHSYGKLDLYGTYSADLRPRFSVLSWARQTNSIRVAFLTAEASRFTSRTSFLCPPWCAYAQIVYVIPKQSERTEEAMNCFNMEPHDEIRRRHLAEIETYRREQERLRDEYEQKRRDDFINHQVELERACEEADAELAEACESAEEELAEAWEDVIEEQNEEWLQLEKDLNEELRL